MKKASPVPFVLVLGVAALGSIGTGFGQEPVPMGQPSAVRPQPTQAAPRAPAVDSRAVAEAVKRGFELIAKSQFNEAKAELEKATAAAGGPCADCLLGLSHVYAAENQWDRSIEAAQQAIPLLRSPDRLARAYNQLGTALVSAGTLEGLAKAEEALRRGASQGGDWANLARYNLSQVLLKQQRWADAAAEARQYLKDAGPESLAGKEARIVLCQARANLPVEVVPTAPLEAEAAPGGVTRPKMIFHTNPQYTAEARAAGTAGKVVLKAVIDQEGCVRDVKALEEQPNGLTDAAKDAVRQWVFLPATLGDQPVNVFYVLTVNFGIDLEHRRP